MKVLLFSDIHSHLGQCQRLVHRAEQEAIDLVIGAGDFGNIRHGLDKTIAVLKAITQPTVLTSGNSESDVELREACHLWLSARVLHGSGTEIEGLSFWGIGGGIPVTPFGDWSFDFTEAEAEAMLTDCPEGAILVSHSPPQGAVDVSSSGRSLGSQTIRQVIEMKKPRLVVCGHIHHSAGKMKMINETPVINAGPQGVVWDLS